MILPVIATLFVVAQCGGMEVVSTGNLEPRPPAADASPLQARIDAARPGDTVVVEAGTYQGDLYVDRPVRLVGRGRPTLVASGRGSVIIVRAPDVTIEGLAIDGRLAGSLSRDSSGIHVAAPRVTIRDVVIDRALFGIYLREADGAVVERSVIRGQPGMAAGEQGSGLHVYNTHRFHLSDNDIQDVRDGVYIQSANHGVVARNAVRRVRYGLHYMYADDNTFEDNTFEGGAAGASIMYSKRLVFRRNRFLHNRGFASGGLLLKDCEDLVAEDNLIADNARGLFLEGSHRNTFRRNVIAVSDVAIVLFDSSLGNVFEGNAFVANHSPLELVGRRSDTKFDGNYWSDAREPDLDGDGIRDRPYRISSVFDHFRGNLTAAELFAQGPGARALAAAEETFPVLAPTTVQDHHPLVRPPHLPAVPLPDASTTPRQSAGLLAASFALAAGLGVIAWGRRRPREVSA
jgi:nitrous oxidase accessory protein